MFCLSEMYIIILLLNQETHLLSSIFRLNLKCQTVEIFDVDNYFFITISPSNIVA
eukprot:UN00912